MRLLVALILASSLSPISPSGNSARTPEWVQPGSGSRSPFINVRAAPYFAPCDGTNDDQPAFLAAIAALPSTGGVIDARSCTAAKFSSSLTIGVAGTALYLPAGTVALGANQIIVSPGIHNVALIGAAPYGGVNFTSASGGGTFLNYTGTTKAVVVGDSTADTYGFRMQDVSIGLRGAGTATIAIQLNRAIQYTLSRPRVNGFGGANTQIAIDLEGFTNFTGGRVEDYYLIDVNTGIYLGKNANANWISGGITVNNNAGGTCINIAGDAAGQASGNMVFGGDCEQPGGSGTAVSIDQGGRNEFFGLRAESIVTYVTASANSIGNMMFGAPNTGFVMTDNGVNTTEPNTFTSLRHMQFSPTAWKFLNRADASTKLELWAGATTGQNVDLTLRKWDATVAWTLRKNTLENFTMLSPASIPRLELDVSTTTFLSSEGSSAINFNNNSNSGTGGVNFGSGGASPSTVASINSTGTLTQTGVLQANLGAPSNGRLIYCSDCTIANPCAGGGTGAFAKRLNGVWVCN